ncbi:MAG: hypothetical protein PVG22_15065 [Chromatiales bacterium]|jgi:hypothetical protein
MLRIDRISLRLPAGYAHRAANIARLLGERMGAEASGLPAGRTEQLTVAVAPASPQVSDGEIARLAWVRLQQSLGIAS